jgi:hypothetical protein
MLVVQITKRRDGGSILRCVRDDGSITWQKQDVRHSSFFALHDLTHFAVESTLGYKRGFFGLIAAGWDIDDTTGKGARGALPPEAGEVERVVGLLDQERACGAAMAAEEFNAFAPRRFSDHELESTRARCAELLGQWRALPAGSLLELRWEP